MISNVLTLSIFIGFLVNIIKIPVPKYFIEALELLSAAGIPVALFAMGGVLTQYRLTGYLQESLIIALISLIIHPLLTLTFASYIFPISDQEIRSAVITAAMAPGVNAFIFSSMYKRSIEIAASSVILCTILSIITSAFWISIIN